MNKSEQDLPIQLDMSFSHDSERANESNNEEPQEPEAEAGKASPFVKWAGGKRSIVGELVAAMPTEFRNYYEPFAGGAALFFELHERLMAAYLSDVNLDLIYAYHVIKKDPEQLIQHLSKHAEKHSKPYYYRIRARHALQDPIEIAARFIYLNKTCYNGLYRVNKKGHFNVPMGTYKNPRIVSRDNILACHAALQKATISYMPFDKIKPVEGDFVYFDPPYHPTDETSFTSYTKLDFSEHDQVRLRDFALELHKRGVKVMLSNSNSRFIADLYKSKPFRLNIVHAPRFVNCKPNGRSNVEEVLITTYDR